jgi:hypothetical protein
VGEDKGGQLMGNFNGNRGGFGRNPKKFGGGDDEDTTPEEDNPKFGKAKRAGFGRRGGDRSDRR